MSYVAPTARVHPDAQIGEGCHIGEFCVVEQDVSLGPGCLLEPYVYIKRWTTLGPQNQVSSGTVLGSDPLDKNFTGARSYLRIGANNRIREHFTISRGTKPETETVIGDGNYIMTAGHIAHDCRIGNQTVICSNVLVAGYVEIEDQVYLSGGVMVHQFSKVGRLALVSGNTRVNVDAPPFFIYYGFDPEPHGLNTVGLQRAGMPAGEIRQLKQAYRLLYRSGLSLAEALRRMELELTAGAVRDLVRFCRASKRGICR
ncbi:MAG: acyl-ACP--UDP-N-acetylglucosamine O-acyltransferase [Acidobacteriota bacterium]|nr:acyl-ACP--UDP-N-acetylglucosamine O-acyltransferase [Acidobacteriota bacterium]